MKKEKNKLGDYDVSWSSLQTQTNELSDKTCGEHLAKGFSFGFTFALAAHMVTSLVFGPAKWHSFLLSLVSFWTIYLLDYLFKRFKK